VTGRCMDCGAEFITDNAYADLCPRCVVIELADLRADAADYYPRTRTEQLRERLGVSGNVDE
jgi:hypothetical protein